MLTSELQEGGKISIIVDKLDFESQIEIIRDEYLLITIIIVDDMIVKFPPGVKADMVYYTNDDKLYIWENVTITAVKYKDGKKYNKVLMPAEEGRKYNRRSNYRLYVGRNMNIDLRHGAESRTLNTVIKDVSVTGFAFVNAEEFENGIKVNLYYEMESGKVIEIPGHIVRTQFIEERQTFVYGCKFSAVSDMLRKEINNVQQHKIKKKMT